MHIGIRKVVKIIINRDKPSTPKIILLLVKNNQLISSINWKCHESGLKKQSKKIEQLNINNDQKSDKFLINT